VQSISITENTLYKVGQSSSWLPEVGLKGLPAFGIHNVAGTNVVTLNAHNLKIKRSPCLIPTRLVQPVVLLGCNVINTRDCA
jgi:hypothetical protein